MICELAVHYVLCPYRLPLVCSGPLTAELLVYAVSVVQKYQLTLKPLHAKLMHLNTLEQFIWYLNPSKSIA